VLKAVLAFIDFLANIYIAPIRWLMPVLKLQDDSTLIDRIICLPFIGYSAPWALYHFNVRKRDFIEVIGYIDPAEAQILREHERFEEYINALRTTRRRRIEEPVNWMKDGF